MRGQLSLPSIPVTEKVFQGLFLVNSLISPTVLIRCTSDPLISCFLPSWCDSFRVVTPKLVQNIISSRFCVRYGRFERVHSAEVLSPLAEFFWTSVVVFPNFSFPTSLSHSFHLPYQKSDFSPTRHSIFDTISSQFRLPACVTRSMWAFSLTPSFSAFPL